MITSLLSLSLHFTPFHLRLKSNSKSFPTSTFTSPSKSLICCSASQNNSNFEREEVRWLREEQRWLREEQRWHREEQRWLRERESLLQEIELLKLRLQSLESRNPVHEASESETIALLQVLKDKNLIAESGTSARELVLEDKLEEVKEVVVEEGVRVLESERRQEEVIKKRKVLRKGSEGDDVRELQVCLQCTISSD